MADTFAKPKPDPVADTTRRDALIAIVSGFLVLAFIIYAIFYLSGRVTGHNIKGVITAKRFQPDPQTQITIGQQGLSKKKVAGEYTFEVSEDSTQRTYVVWVDPRVYQAKKVGDAFEFPRPARASAPSVSPAEKPSR